MRTKQTLSVDELVAEAARRAAAEVADNVRATVAEALSQREPREYLSPAQLAEMLGVHPVTVDTWRSEGRGPPFVRAGRRILYRRSDIDSWLEAQAATGGTR